MTEPGTKEYRRGVGIVLLNTKGEIFAGRRIDTPGAWQMPQGGIDKNEEPRTAALRELKEETGTDRAEIIAETSRWLTYELPGDMHLQAWGGRYRGQIQKWFAMRFLGKDSDIRLDLHEPEFDKWKWIGRDELLESIVDFKRPMYEDIFKEFAGLLWS